VRDDHRVAVRTERRLAFFQAVRVAFAITEPERIDRRPGQLDPGKGAVVEQHLGATLGPDAEMMAAVAAR
jgi:hypothetical protein